MRLPVSVISALLVAPPQLVPRPPARAVRSGQLVAQERDQPPLDLLDKPKVGFARTEDETRTSFAPTAVRTETPRPETVLNQNEQLLAEIRALQPDKPGPAPERVPVDLNGINPLFLVLGAASYGTFSFFAWQFTCASAEFFAEHPMDSAFYVVARLSSLARVVVVGLGALGTGVTAIAGVGQLLLSVQVAIGVAKGDLDMNAERVDPYGGRKKGELEKMLAFMMGNKNQVL